MATFTCTACNFSKPVADEMAGKKARCPKCNAVMTIPPLGEEDVVVSEPDTEVETAEHASAPESQEKAESAPAPASASRSSKQEEATTEFTPVAQTWLMGLGGAILLVVVAVILFVLQQINLGIICFAAGILAFAAISAMFCFGPGAKS